MAEKREHKTALPKRLLLLLGCLAAVLGIAGASLFIRGNQGEKETKEKGPGAQTAVTAESEEQDTQTGGTSSALYDKSETVYVKADASGEAREITVEAVLKNPGDGSDILDVSNLKDIRNTKGDEEFSRGSDGSLVWENHGEDISYKGTSEAELPVGVSVSYFLNGEQVTPEEIAGKSGSVRIRFDYDNRAAQTVETNGESYEVCTPFLAMTALALPSDIFSGVEVTNGKLLQMDSQNMVIGFCLPGLTDSLKLAEYEVTEEIEIPEYLEITAEASEFELEFTATVITPGLLEDLDTEDLKDADELADSMDDLKEGVNDLDEGVGELYEGLEEFADYLEEYTEGAEALNDGMRALRDGLRALSENKAALLTGAQALQSGLEQIQAALGSAGSGSGGDGAGTDSGAGSGSAGDGAGTDSEAQTALSAGQAAFTKIVEALAGAAALDPDTATEEQLAAQQALFSSLGLTAEDVSALQAYAAYLAKSSESLSQMQTQLSALQTAVAQLAAGSRQLTEGITAFGDGVGALYDGSVKLKEGTSALADAGEELSDGFGEAVDGVGELRDGVKEFNEDGVSELTKLAGDDFRNVVNRLRALKEADGLYMSFSGLSAGKSGSVRFIVETEKVE